jgi:peptide/nickel transport system substrate-binding protein
VFHLKVKDGAFLNKIVGYLFIVPKAYTESLPSPEAFANAPIGTGAFKFVERKLGQSVTLERFDDYFGPKPKIKKIIFRIIEEPSSRVNALLTGEVDITDGIPSVDVERLKATQGVAVMPTPIASPLAVRIYSNDPKTPFHDRRVRLALNYALDTNSLIKNVLHGVGAPLSSYISSFYSIGTDKNLKPYEYNPAKAKQLLKEAGYPKGFETSLYSPSDMPKDIAETIAAYWSQVGIQTKIQRIDYAAWSRLNNTHKSSPLTVMQFSNAIFDPIHPVAGAASTKGTWSDYSNPEVDKLLAQVNETPDRAERDRLFKQVGKILHDDGHAVLLTELYYIFGKDSKINWEPRSGISWYDLRGASWLLTSPAKTRWKVGRAWWRAKRADDSADLNGDCPHAPVYWWPPLAGDRDDIARHDHHFSHHPRYRRSHASDAAAGSDGSGSRSSAPTDGTERSDYLAVFAVSRRPAARRSRHVLSLWTAGS